MRAGELMMMKRLINISPFLPAERASPIKKKKKKNGYGAAQLNK